MDAAKTRRERDASHADYGDIGPGAKIPRNISSLCISPNSLSDISS